MRIERVPEHSLSLMTAMSRGRPLSIDDYQFFYGDGWLMAIAWPLRGAYDSGKFEAALEKAIDASDAGLCYAIGSSLPESLHDKIISRDRYYVLGSAATLPSRLKNPLKKAAQVLEVSEGCEFTAQHRRLWNEFLSFKGSGGQMSDRVMQLYLATSSALPLCAGKLRLLDARDRQGNLVASLLLDYAPAYFTSYILGAHSRRFMVPHAMDLLFWNMIQNARQAGKRYLHLGLGVNDGILRFKQKWGARSFYPYQMAEWQINDKISKSTGTDAHMGEAMHDLAIALLRGGNKSARQYLDELPESSPFAMIWEVEKDGKTSWVSGTAHFFCRSFEPSFRKLFRKAHTAVFEGPLDNGFMEQVEAAGKVLPTGKIPLYTDLEPEDLKNLDKLINGAKAGSLFPLSRKIENRVDIAHLLRTGNYWYAFFTLWTKFLERQGWKESVDMEAWRIASDMKLNIVSMENLEEQLESLSSLPRERVIRFFRNCNKWKSFARRNKDAYLAGDLEKMMGSSAEFPTRTEHVVGRRDQRFRERMRPWLLEGNCAVFVGCAHMINLRHMLREDGFRVRQKPFGLWPKLHLKWRNLKRPDEKVAW